MCKKMAISSRTKSDKAFKEMNKILSDMWWDISKWECRKRNSLGRKICPSRNNKTGAEINFDSLSLSNSKLAYIKSDISHFKAHWFLNLQKSPFLVLYCFASMENTGKPPVNINNTEYGLGNYSHLYSCKKHRVGGFTTSKGQVLALHLIKREQLQ